jgi:hypothetical protein
VKEEHSVYFSRGYTLSTQKYSIVLKRKEEREISERKKKKTIKNVKALKCDFSKQFLQGNSSDCLQLQIITGTYAE